MFRLSRKISRYAAILQECNPGVRGAAERTDVLAEQEDFTPHIIKKICMHQESFWASRAWLGRPISVILAVVLDR